MTQKLNPSPIGRDRPAADRGPAPKRAGHRLGRAALGIPLMAAAAWLGRKAGRKPQDVSLPPALAGERRERMSGAGRLAYYVAGPEIHDPEAKTPPLLLIHSINAAGSAYEVGPLYDRNRARRCVYAIDLPGFGFSERRDQLYTPRLMTDAILAMVDEIQARHGAEPIDAIALSLSSEYLARAASERPAAFRSIGLVSPTGFDRRGPRLGPPGSHRGLPALYKTFTFGLWRHSFFKLLTSRVSIRYFLEKTWGSKNIDEGLLAYDYLTTQQPHAEHAPYCFISGYLFSNDITRIYDGLTLPVWMAHGTRGDFTDYSGQRRIETRPNWTIDIFETGALPHFEQPELVQARYDAFLSQLMT
jgi:pimeloyl-ACP methyl ester carboxylesterase